MANRYVSKISTHYRELVERTMPKYFYRSTFLSKLYYFFLSSSFDREMKAVLSGKQAYYSNKCSKQANYYLLVRNIHRLEKGLLMRPRRAAFAEGYIEVTVDNYLLLQERKDTARSERYKWFEHVLVAYFDATSVSEAKAIVKSRNKFFGNKIQNDPTHTVKFTPYFRDLTEDTISYDAFYELSRRRRSVRWFLEKPVPRELIEKAIAVALQSPSACNRQPFEYRIVDEEEMLRKLVKLPGGTSGYSHSIRAMIVCVGNLDAYFRERDRHLIYIDASLANMSLMYALEILGLGSCPINWPDIEKKEKQMDYLLNLKSYQRPIMCIGIGYPDPDGMVAYSAKEDVSKVITYN